MSMAAYSGGDVLNAVVAEVGSYTTRLGFAGEDHPRSIFRSTSAVLRSSAGDRVVGKKATKSKASSAGTIQEIRRDFLSRPIEKEGDGEWELANPVDPTTGLVFEGAPPASEESGGGSSHNANDDEEEEEAKKPTPKRRRGAKKDEGDDEEPPWDCHRLFNAYLEHGYESSLCTSPSSHPLLLVEKSYNVPPLRQRTLELLFEQHDVPATFLVRDAVSACYAVGRTTGTVVDVGYNAAVITPVYDGYVEQRGVLRNPGAGSRELDKTVLETIDGLYKTKLSKRGKRTTGQVDYVLAPYQVRAARQQQQQEQQQSHPQRFRRKEPFHSLARREVGRDCRESGAGCAVGPTGYGRSDQPQSQASDETWRNAPKIPYELPDGTMVHIPHVARYDACEVLLGSDEKYARRREEKVGRVRKRLDAVIASATSSTSSGEGGSGDRMSGTDFGGATTVAGVDARYASGMRRGGGGRKVRGGGDAAALSFRNRRLAAACTPHLSTSLGELSPSPLPQLVCDAAFKCDRDQQAQLLGNVVLCGGGSCISPDNALPDRLREEVEAIIHTHTPGWRVKVLSPNLPERAVCSWLGGSILGSLGSFHEMWITRAEYDEFGPAIVNRKCP